MNTDKSSDSKMGAPLLASPFRGDKYVTPLYRIASDEIPEQGASGIWLSIDNVSFLITAAHAIDDGFVWFPMKKGFKKIESPVVATTPPNDDRAQDSVDLAIVQLVPNDVISRHPFYASVDMGMIEVNLTYRFKDLYEFTGYPFEREILDHERKIHEPGYMSVTSETVSEQEFRELGLSIHTHVVIAFQRDQMIENGKTIVAPLPDGVSGGAVWKRYSNSDQRKLAAIAIEYRRNCLIGTRISAILEFIRITCPDLARSIPRPTDLGVDFQLSRNGVPIN